MKIGILTFHRANNLGAILQASALQEYIKEIYGETEIIDYYPNNDIPKHPTVIRKILRGVKRFLTYKTSKMYSIKEKKFSDYREKYMNISSTKYYGDDSICNAPPKYDIYISGSDQILNTTLTGNSEAYYLKFVQSGKKISYASSFGRTHVSDIEKQLISKELIKFESLSVRESSGKDIIAEIIHKEATLVVDPVFLLDESSWMNKITTKLKCPQRYIFVYSMEKSGIIEDLVTEAIKEYKLPVIFVRGGGNDYKIKAFEDFTCGPEDFLYYIKNAELVVTNSFHGTAFSLIFRKKILCIAHSTRNTRIENLMDMIGMRDHIIDHTVTQNELNKYIVDGDKNSVKLKTYIDISKEYIQKSLGD